MELYYVVSDDDVDNRVQKVKGKILKNQFITIASSSEDEPLDRKIRRYRAKKKASSKKSNEIINITSESDSYKKSSPPKKRKFDSAINISSSSETDSSKKSRRSNVLKSSAINISSSSETDSSRKSRRSNASKSSRRSKKITKSINTISSGDESDGFIINDKKMKHYDTKATEWLQSDDLDDYIEKKLVRGRDIPIMRSTGVTLLNSVRDHQSKCYQIYARNLKIGRIYHQLIMPTNVGNSHWVLMVLHRQGITPNTNYNEQHRRNIFTLYMINSGTIMPEQSQALLESTANHFRSCIKYRKNAHECKFRRYFGFNNETTIETEYIDLGIQTDNYNCGFYVLSMIEELTNLVRNQTVHNPVGLSKNMNLRHFNCAKDMRTKMTNFMNENGYR